MRFPLFCLTLSLLVSCQPPTSTSPGGTPVAPPPAAGSLTLINKSTTGLTLSAYDPADPSTKPPALVTAPLVAAGQSAVITLIPADRDLWFRALDDLPSGTTTYSLVSAGVPRVFRLSPLRAYTLEFSADATATPPLVWNWQLAANPSYEVSNLKATPGTNSLTLTWSDPAMADLVSLSVKPVGGTEVSVAKGVQTVTLTGLAGGLAKTVRVTAVYPEAGSQGLPVTGTPKAPATVVTPSVSYTEPSQSATSVSVYPGTIKVRFNTAIDGSSLTEETFQVKNGTVAVPGTVVFQNYTATFTPAADLPPATSLTVSLTTGIKSLSGGALAAPYTWSFTTGTPTVPTVSSVSPYRDGIYVDPGLGEVSVSFSTMLLSSAVGVDQLTLADDTGNVAGVVSRKDYSLVFTPVAPLKEGTTYTATVAAGVRSYNGGVLAAPYSWKFKTRIPSLFEPARLLEVPSWPQAAALGDVTGDGLVDVIGLTGSYPPGNEYANKLVTIAQTSSGWGTPVFLPTSAKSGALACVVVGDINGDGNPEVLVGEEDGIEIFVRNGSGGLSLLSKLVTADSSSIRVADLNQDGRLDVAGIGYGTSTVSVWLQKADRSLGAAQTYAAPHGGRDTLGVGDLNGDGRNDLVVQSGQMYAIPALQILTQNTAGGFNSAVSLSIGANLLASGLAVADLNGDGNEDLLVSYGGNQGRVSLLPQAAGIPSAVTATYATYDIPTALESADVNGDGRKDAVLFHNGWKMVGVLLQKSDGTLETEEHLSPIGSNQCPLQAPMAVGNINADNKPDVVVATDAGLVVLLGR